jgi:RNA polymerase sigma factor (TIGR02999 family)
MEPTMQRSDVTQALVELSAGDPSAFDRLLPLVYHQLKVLARGALRGERPDHTLTPTALVHETYVKLVRLDRITWRDRAHFLGAAAQAMRRILISYARSKRAEKRGGPLPATADFENVLLAAATRPAELLVLDEALDRLALLSQRQARVVECRFFAEMSLEETAVALGISPATVKREWTVARAWLNREMVG